LNTLGAIPIPGARNPQQMIENAGALGWRLRDIDVARLDAVSLKGESLWGWQHG